MAYDRIDSAPAGNFLMSRNQLGLDGRHRDADGRVERKHGNTLVGTLRDTYGESFARGFRSDAKLSTVLKETGNKSLSKALKRGEL